MKFRPFYLLLVLSFTCIHIGTAQQITTNENGEKIIVSPDGSWRYAEDADIEEDNKRSLPEPAATQEDLEMKMAIEIAEEAAAEEAEAIRIEEAAKDDRMAIENELEEAEGSDDFFEDDIAEIKDRLKAAKKREKATKSARKSASKKATKAEKLLTMDQAQRTKVLKQYEAYKNLVNANADTSTNEEPTVLSTSATSPSKVSYDSNVAFAKYDPSKDVLFNPPSPDCQLSFDGMDEFSGKKRKDVQKQLFFTYTNEELRSVFKDRDYMTCEGYLSSLSGGLVFLTLNITIASKTAQREYGILEKGGLINIKLLNGENVKLVNSKTNMGAENPLEGSYSYRAQYLVSSGDEKKLKKSEVDKVRVVWSSGYEDYEVYELDFFIDQFACLNEK